ncbi:DNA polymerase Y family protein [Leucobacter sp. NPDC077196]|uniref:DNA polymerase Y family protein n=1 Tax=Leucobacter sp. NPDC077196 TaxID=3154959 RepID=UPI003435F3FF
MTAERTLVFWVPDWPVHALLRDDGADGLSPDAPLALIANRVVIACSAAARREGVRTGLREREAQTRCPELAVYPHHPETDERRFAPIAAALEQLVPGVEVVRPGLCAMRARGPSRYYGGEVPAGAAVLRLADELGLPDTRVGIADGRFTAEQVARSASTDPGISAPAEGLRIVEPGASPAFLSPLPVARAMDARLAETLQGLGIRTLGAFAALPEDAVRQRFGPQGLAAHRRASASGAGHGAEVRPRQPVRELSVELSFDTPIDAADHLAFACSALAERFIGGLTEDRLVCTALRVELTDDVGAQHEREWAHPRHFTAADTVGRIRWQAAATAQQTERGGAGVTRVRITPVQTDHVAAHEPGLWSTEPDERVHHHLSRAQSRLGHTGVGTVALAGGRLLSDRQRFVPWSTTRVERAHARASASGPWPGALTGPAPSSVFPEVIPAALLDTSGAPVNIDADDLLSADPARLRVAATEFDAPVAAWSPPWAVRERWWEGAPARFRVQVQLADGDAWLLIFSTGVWAAEGRYD